MLGPSNGLAALPSSSLQSLLSWGGMALPAAAAALGRSGGALHAVVTEQRPPQEQAQGPTQAFPSSGPFPCPPAPRSGGLFEGLPRAASGEGRRGWRRSSCISGIGHSSSMQQRAYASQPAYAFNDEHEHDDHHELVTPSLTRSHRIEGSPEHAWGPEIPPWDFFRDQRSYKISQYRREIFHFDQWVYCGQPAAIPIIGRSRFDPPTLHGPWMRPGVTSEELERQVEVLAALPRQELQLALPLDLESQALAADEQAQGAAGRSGDWVAGEGDSSGRGGRGDDGTYPKTLFDDPSDLTNFADPHVLLAPPDLSNGRRGYYRRRRTKAEIAAAQAVAAEKAAARLAAQAAAEAAALAAAEAEQRHAQGADRSGLALPVGLTRTAAQRRVVDLSGTLPNVLGALRAAGVEPDRPLVAALRKALSRTDPDARMQPRNEPGDKGSAPLLISPASASAMADFLTKELLLSPKNLRRLVIRSPWVMGLDLNQEVMPVVECLRHIVDVEVEKIGRMVVQHPRTLVAQVDDHLLPMVDYLQSLGCTPRHMRRIFTANPLFTENFSSCLLRTCVAFWLGKGMTRHDLVSFLVQYPKVLSLSQMMCQLKYDWLKEAIDYDVADHARNPILLSRSLTEVLGPRISYALHRGFTVYRPTDTGRRRPGRRGVGDDATTAKEITQIGLDTFIKRVRGDKQEYLEFKERWAREALPAWLAKHGADLDYYHSMVWLKELDKEE